MITGINVLKTLTKHISCECKCKFDGIKCNSNQWWNNNKCLCHCKKVQVREKDYVCNPATCNCENGKYLLSVMDDSGITCDGVIKSYDEKINLNEIKAICKMQSFYILVAFLLITITKRYYSLLIAVSIYGYLKKY